MTYDPIIPLALWFPLAIATAGLLSAYAFASRRRLPGSRRWWMLGLMTFSALAPLYILLNPTWVRELPAPGGKPQLTILVDRSLSMNAVDDGGGSTRFARASETARSLAAELGNKFDVRTRVFDETWEEVGLEMMDRISPQGAGTDMAAAIEAAIDHRGDGEAIMLLSDGIHNSVGGAEALLRSVDRARAMASPIFTATIGGEATVNDLELSVGLSQEMAYINQQVPVSVTVRQRGAIADRATIQLLLDDQVMDTQTIPIGVDETAEAVLQVSQSNVGLYRYDIRIAGLPQEVTQLNNHATMMLRVVDEPVKVLLLEGKPYWDTKFLVRTLSQDESIELTSLVRVTDDRFIERTVQRTAANDGGADARTETWNVHAAAQDVLEDADRLSQFQIVVLGREADIFLTDRVLRQLKTWIAEGDGALVCYRGAPASQIEQRLGSILPVRWSPARESRFRVQWTQSGQALRWLPGERTDSLARMPSLATVARPEQPKPLAVVLATVSDTDASRQPVISYQPVGSGRVVVVEGAGMWRWAFLPPDYDEHDDVYGVLWRSLVRWLVANAGMLPSQDVALRNDKVSFDVGETATATMLVRPGKQISAPMVQLSGGPLKAPLTIQPQPVGEVLGQYRVVFGELDAGRYLAEIAKDGGESAAKIAFDVQSGYQEQLELTARDDLMRRIADASGGAVLDAKQPANIARQVRTKWEQAHPPRLSRTMAWDSGWVLGGVLALWTAAWALRRSSGLI